MSASADMVLPFDLQSYWLHSSGEGGGADFDLVMERGADDLPLLRGRHVAGLLRLALERAAVWGWFNDLSDITSADVSMVLMGDRKGSGPGCLDVRSAIVAEPLRTALQNDAALLAACFHRVATTAIDGIRNVAREGHLRSIEAALPLPLRARVRFDAADRLAWSGADDTQRALIDRAEANWQKWLRTAWPALDEVGAKRTRGFGRLGWVDLDLHQEAVP